MITDVIHMFRQTHSGKTRKELIDMKKRIKILFIIYFILVLIYRALIYFKIIPDSLILGGILAFISFFVLIWFAIWMFYEKEGK